jgi:hypothetical protein
MHLVHHGRSESSDGWSTQSAIQVSHRWTVCSKEKLSTDRWRSLYVLGFIGHFYVIAYHVHDTNYFAEENVIAPVHVEDSFVQKGLSGEQRAAEHAKERAAALMGQGEILEGVMALEAAPAQQGDVKHGMESTQTEN